MIKLKMNSEKYRLFGFIMLSFFLLCNSLSAQQWEKITGSLLADINKQSVDEKQSGISLGTMVVLPKSGDIVVVQNGNHPVYRSSDQGNSWQQLPAKNTIGRTYGAFSVNVDPLTSRMIVFNIVQKKNGPTRGLLLDPEGDMLWEISRPEQKHDGWTWGMPNWEEKIPQTILGKQHHAFVVLWLSKDGGKTWKKLDFESRNPGVVNSKVFVAGNDDGIYRTVDEGKTWHKVSDIKVNGKNPVKYGDAIYWTAENGVIKSSDEGKTWKLQGAELKDALYGPFFGKNKKWMMVVNEEGFFITWNEGKKWSKVAFPFVAPGAKKLKTREVELMHPTNSYGWDWNNKIIYAGNLGGDIYRMQLDSYNDLAESGLKALTIPKGKPLKIKSIEFVEYKRPRYYHDRIVKRMACRVVAENGSFGLADWKTDEDEKADGQAKVVNDIKKYLPEIEKVLIGKDARKVEKLHDQLPDEGKILIDRALWDLIARDAGKPVHELFGTKRKEIPVYYSKGVIDYFEDVRNRTGCDAWKIHAWPQKPGEELSATATMQTHEPPLTPSNRCNGFFKEARNAVGKNVTIIADCHYHFVKSDHIQYTDEDVVELAKGLQKLNVLWMEGLPFVAENPELFKKLKEEIPGLRLQQEYPNSMKDIPMVRKAMEKYPELLNVQAADPITMSFTEQVRFARWCIEHGKFFDSHWPDYTSLQLAAAMTDNQYPFYEIGGGEFHRELQAKNGVLEAPVVPGLAPIRFPVDEKREKWQTVDWSYILKNRIDN